MLEIIDAHQHFWKIEAQQQSWRSPAHISIERDYLPAHLAEELRSCNIAGTVLMQSVDTREENDRLFTFAEEAPYVKGVVAWLPLQDSVAAKREITRISRRNNLCGVRTLIAADNLSWLTTESSIEVFRKIASGNLAWDVVPITDTQIQEVKKLAKLVPDLRIIVDHMGRPPVDSEGWQPWAKNMELLSESPNIAIKISIGIDVLTAWSDWNQNSLERYVHHVLECFGPERALLASNWPVILLRNSYKNAWKDLVELVRSTGASDGDLATVMGSSALKWYGLGR